MSNTTETMSANQLAHLLFYGMTQGTTDLSDIHWFMRYLSEEEKQNTLQEFSKVFGIPMDYLIQE